MIMVGSAADVSGLEPVRGAWPITEPTEGCARHPGFADWLAAWKPPLEFREFACTCKQSRWTLMKDATAPAVELFCRHCGDKRIVSGWQIISAPSPCAASNASPD